MVDTSRAEEALAVLLPVAARFLLENAPACLGHGVDRIRVALDVGDDDRLWQEMAHAAPVRAAEERVRLEDVHFVLTVLHDACRGGGHHLGLDRRDARQAKPIDEEFDRRGVDEQRQQHDAGNQEEELVADPLGNTEQLGVDHRPGAAAIDLDGALGQALALGGQIGSVLIELGHIKASDGQAGDGASRLASVVAFIMAVVVFFPVAIVMAFPMGIAVTGRHGQRGILQFLPVAFGVHEKDFRIRSVPLASLVFLDLEHQLGGLAVYHQRQGQADRAAQRPPPDHDGILLGEAVTGFAHDRVQRANVYDTDEVDRHVNQREHEKINRLRVNLERDDHADHDENDHVGDEGGKLPEFVHEVLHLRADPSAADPSPDQAQRHQPQHAGDGEKMFAGVKHKVCRHQHHRGFHVWIVEHSLHPRHADEADQDAQHRAAQPDNEEAGNRTSCAERFGTSHRADQDDKRHDGGAVIQQRLALDQCAEFFAGPQLLEQRHHSHGVGGARDSPKKHCKVDAQITRTDIPFSQPPAQRIDGDDAEPCHDRGCHDTRSRHVECIPERFLEDVHIQRVSRLENQDRKEHVQHEVRIKISPPLDGAAQRVEQLGEKAVVPSPVARAMAAFVTAPEGEAQAKAD